MNRFGENVLEIEYNPLMPLGTSFGATFATNTALCGVEAVNGDAGGEGTAGAGDHCGLSSTPPLNQAFAPGAADMCRPLCSVPSSSVAFR